MNIAFDIDGVLTDFEWFLETYGSRYFSRHSGQKAFRVKASASVAERFGYSEEWEKKFYTRYLFWYAKHYPIRENAAETIRELRQQGHKVYFITARALAEKNNVLGKWSRACLYKWLRQNRVDYDGIEFVSVNNSPAEKCSVCRKLGIDIFVEDDAANIEQLSKICKVICMSADYNETVSGGVRVLDFGEIYWYICGNTDFKILHHKEREKLEAAQKTDYFQKLKEYYENLPFDAHYLKTIEKNIGRAWFFLHGAIQLFYPTKIVSGNLPVNCEKTIFVCNHRRALDVPLCYITLHKIRARVLTKREFEASPIGSFMRKIGIIFLEREKKSSGKITQNLMIQTLLHGGNILLFPEGTRNRTQQKLLPFKMGAVYMAQVTGAAVIPLIIQKDKRHYRVTIGNAIHVGALDDLEDANARLKKTMEQMLDE
jgi:1-acyl-sn-glycerol-3-phosphate acyltransferase